MKIRVYVLLVVVLFWACLPGAGYGREFNGINLLGHWSGYSWGDVDAALNVVNNNIEISCDLRSETSHTCPK